MGRKGKVNGRGGGGEKEESGKDAPGRWDDKDRESWKPQGKKIGEGGEVDREEGKIMGRKGKVMAVGDGRKKVWRRCTTKKMMR